MSRILKSIFGRQLGLDSDGRLICPAGIRTGDHGSQFDMPGPTTVTRFDDFTGAGQAFSTTPVDGWLSRKGTTNTIDWTVTEAKNGTVVGKIGDTTASMAVSGVQLSAGLDWRADMGMLNMEARVKTGIITNIAIYVGFTDQVSALEMPIQSAASADTITTNATDAVGFMFDTSMATDNWWLVGVANDVDATLQNMGSAPVADTYETLRIALDANGNAVFFRNGLQVGVQMASAVTKTVALTPVIAAFNRTTTNGATTIITADYIQVSATRA
jgi:tartrate dehydratase beta subunit/fumarate hydratase class I family protein